MAEQAPLEPCRALPPPPPPPPLHGPSLRHETYVVQVPKDQIYRVPPPENAALVEHYRNQVELRRQNRCPCFHVFKRLLLPVFLPLLLLAAAAIIFFACVKPTAPTFSVKSLTVKKTSKSTTEYDFSVRVLNPSNRVGLSYADGGHAVASRRGGAEFATGSTPGFFQPHGNTTDLKLVLRSSKSLKATGKAALWIELTAKFSVNTKIGRLQLWRMSLDVNCDVKVTGIDKKARISSQDCNSNLHS